MRKIINLLKEPIYKDDLHRVLLYGILNAVLFGVFAGALQFFANIYLGLGFSIVIYMIAYMIGKELRDRVFTYHILYSILGIVFFLIGYLFYNISYASFVLRDIVVAIQFVFSLDGLFGFAFRFLNIYSYVGINIFNNIMDIIILIFCFMTVWRMSTYRK